MGIIVRVIVQDYNVSNKFIDSVLFHSTSYDRFCILYCSLFLILEYTFTEPFVLYICVWVLLPCKDILLGFLYLFLLSYIFFSSLSSSSDLRKKKNKLIITQKIKKRTMYGICSGVSSFEINDLFRISKVDQWISFRQIPCIVKLRRPDNTRSHGVSRLTYQTIDYVSNVTQSEKTSQRVPENFVVTHFRTILKGTLSKL